MNTAQGLFSFFLNILNFYVVPIIFALAFVMFLWGVYKYFIAGGANEEKVSEGQKFVLWSIIGFVIMFSIWGIINIFINTLGFNSASRPALPTFGGTTTGVTSTNAILNALFGGSGSGGGSTVFGGNGNGALTPGQKFSSGGYTYTATGANTYAPVSGASNGGCGPTGTPSGGHCVTNSSLSGGNGNGSGPSAVSGTPKGGSCTVTSGNPDGNCEGALICSSGSCQQDPNLENGDGTLNSACVPPGDCDGNYVCDVNSDTCQDPSTAGVSDGSNAKSNGDGSLGSACVPPGDCDGNYVCDVNSDTCESPDAAGVSDGGLDGSTPGDGTVLQGGSCAGNENACESGTCDPDGICTDEDSGNGTNADGRTQCDFGTVAPGYNCVLCSDGSTTADSVQDCPADASGGYDGNDNGGDANDNSINSTEDNGSNDSGDN